ncbi:hypothetical protein RB195_006403 [Necator americanus]|uniref:Secreted protein n=1 Tax=Necator americanus TaxID=51031 RepID=A0ABR1BW88_NECAM
MKNSAVDHVNGFLLFKQLFGVLFLSQHDGSNGRRHTRVSRKQHRGCNHCEPSTEVLSDAAALDTVEPATILIAS